MNLKEKINTALTQAMKEKNSVRLDTLRSIRAEILKMEKSGINREMTEEEENQLIAKQAKLRKESIEIFEQNNRQDLADREKAQLEIIGEFLPKPLTEAELKEIIENVFASFAEPPAQKDFGKVMGQVMKEVKGRADGKAIQELVKQKFA
jgi:uncharacterized protein